MKNSRTDSGITRKYVASSCNRWLQSHLMSTVLILVILTVEGFSISSLSSPSQQQQQHHVPSQFKKSSSSSCPRLSNNNPLSIRGGGAIGSSSTSSTTSTKLFLVNPAVASVLAGSIAGAVGVGVAFPLDTLKTKAQVMAQEANNNIKKTNSDGTSTADIPSAPNMFQLIGMIYKREGLGGFFGGVKGMMVGQALIKSVAFSVNAITLDFLRQAIPSLPSTSFGPILLAACFSGFITGFLVAPIERIKIMMQADSTKTYKNEFDCLRVVLQQDGWYGLMVRGLGPTLTREIPSYGLYFFMYGVLSQLPTSQSLGAFAPLLNGALSGMASWIPVYPVDVVKTLVQNQVGEAVTGDGGDLGSFAVARQLYEDGGVGAFFDGLTPKMLRAAVNHSVTFFVYDIIANLLID